MTDNRTTELLPCPFCGGEAAVERIGRSGYYYVACNTAYCCDFGKFDTEAEAIAAWNARAELGSGTCEFKPFADEDWSEPNAVRGVCSKCSALMYGKDNYCSNCGKRIRKKVDA